MTTDIPSLLAEAHALGVDAAPAGRTASYIPELAGVDPGLVGIAIETVDGDRFAVGDAKATFTLQSISKVFALALVMRERGMDALEGMSCEPSGDAFHSIVKLEEERGHPRNPYINAGAILVSSRLPGADPATRIDALRRFLSEASDADGFDLDEAVYRSEATTGFRNRALASFMKHYGMLDDPFEAADTYFRQCSLTVDVQTLCRAGLFLANKGTDPLTGHCVVPADYNRTLVALMATCGLYDQVGTFAIATGLPAKSAVSGAILAIVPGRMAITVFGPALGPKGNSIAGMAMLSHLSRGLDLSLFG